MTELRTMDERMPINIGHGHVYARPDGVKARCGGPALCSECARDLARQQHIGPLGWTVEQFVYDGLRTCREQIAVRVGEDREGWVKDEWYWLELQKLVRGSHSAGEPR